MKLYPPEDFDKLYVRPWYTHNWNWARFTEIHDIDFQKYPKMKSAHPVEATLRAGELLYIDSV